MPEVSKPTVLEEELNQLKDELGSYRDAVAAAFGIYTANPHATVMHLARTWEEDLRALLALTGQRCVICQLPATREIRGQDTYFCDEHEYEDLPPEIKDVLCGYGARRKCRLDDIPFASSIRRAVEVCSTALKIRN